MSVSADLNKWFVCPRVKPEAETRLFLFPYAGGGPAVFNKWASAFPGNVEAWIAHYPGRGSRHAEPPIRELPVFAERFTQAMRPLLDRPFGVFGHSLGGRIAFELTRQLRRQELPLPQVLFVSACAAPHVSDPESPIHELLDPEFIKSLQKWNGIPSELLNQPEVMELLLPILRADFEAAENYRYQPGQSPLHVPIVAFAGLDDSRVSRERVEGWSFHTNAGFKSYYFPGDHFFLHTCTEAILASVTTELASSHEKN